MRNGFKNYTGFQTVCFAGFSPAKQTVMWVLFKRLDGEAVVMDSASYLEENIRTDFDVMQPKWFIEVKKK